MNPDHSTTRSKPPSSAGSWPPRFGVPTGTTWTQIRDCYLEMGVEPPEVVRLLGHGLYESAQRYQLADELEKYFDFDADIPGYRTIDIGQASNRVCSEP